VSCVQAAASHPGLLSDEHVDEATDLVFGPDVRAGEAAILLAQEVLFNTRVVDARCLPDYGTYCAFCAL